MAPCVEPLEVRLVPTTISLTGDGNLLIDTSDNTAVDQDRLEIRADVTNSKFIISDPTQILITSIFPSTTSPDQHLVEIPFSSLPNAKKLLVDTFGGDDFITLSAFGGSFNLSPVINSGDGFDDINSTAVILVPAANEDLFLSAENIRLGGNLTTNGGKITLDGNVFLMNDVTLTTVGASAGDVQINGQLDSAAGPSVYTLITTPRSYADALAQAAVDVPGGYLVTIRSAAEQAMVKSAAGNSDVWIGASDGPIEEIEGTWQWESGPDFGVQFWNGDGTTGTPVNGEYSNWFPGEPDDSPAPGDAAFLTGNDTIGGSADPGGWSDGNVNIPRAYIVETPTTFALTVNSGTSNVQFSGSVGNLLPLKFLDVTANQTSVFGGSISTIKSQTYNSAVALSGPALLRAEEVNFGGGTASVTGSENLTLAPIKRDAPITVGSATDVGVASFDITDTDIAALAPGFMMVLIGEPPNQGEAGMSGPQFQSIGPVTVTSATLLNPVLIAGGSISVTELNAGTNRVDLIASTGSITDGGDAGADVTAAVLILDSFTGVGTSGNPLDTEVSAIAARAFDNGGVFVANTGNLTIGPPDAQGGAFANDQMIAVSSTGSITVSQPIASNGGDISLTAASGITINGVPVDTSTIDSTGGQFTADADSDNDGAGTFSIVSLTEFVDWTTTTQGVFADGTTVDLSTSSLVTATAQVSGGDTRFSDGNTYLPAQAAGDMVETRFAGFGEAVFFSFSAPQFGLFLHFDGIQYQGTPFDPATQNPIDLYTFNQPAFKFSGDNSWEIGTESNSIRQLSGDELADQDGTVGFAGGVDFLTFARAADGVSPGNENVVNVQLGLFRAGVLMTAGGAVTIQAADVELDGFFNADAGLVRLIPSGTNRTVDLGATGGSGQFVLTDDELHRISTAGGIEIGNTSTGQITINEMVTRPAATDLVLTVANNQNIVFVGSNASLNANGGNVSLTTGGTGAIRSGDAIDDIRAAGVTIAAGSGGIGETTNPLALNADFLNSSTSGNGDQFVSEVNDLTIGASGLNAGMGTVRLDGGVFKLGGSDRINDGTTLSVGPSATFQLNGFAETLAGLTDAGSVINGSGTAATLTISNSGDIEFFGTLGGAATLENNFSLTKSGGGSLTLSGTNTYSGTTTVNAGTLRINGSTTSATTVASGGTLGGSGTIDGSVTVNNGGTVAPGNSPGILHTGDVSFTSGSTFAVEVNGDIPLELHDQLDVTGTVNLGGATLSATSTTITTLPGQLIVLINNDDTDAIVGTFAGLAEGATVTINSVVFVLSYRGGTGNDVTLAESGTMNFLGTRSDDSIELREATISGNDYLQIVMGGVVVEQRLSASVTDLSIAGDEGNDTLTIDYGGSGGFFNKLVTFDGGDPTSGLGDSLILTGGSFATATYFFTNASDGFVELNGFMVVAYTGLEPITDNLDVTDRGFNFSNDAETITLSDAVGTAMTIGSSNSESVTFLNPSGSLSLNAGGGDDSVQIVSVDADFRVPLTINGGTGTDTVSVDTDLTLGSGSLSGSVSIISEAINLNANIRTDLGTNAGPIGLIGAVQLGADVALDSNSASGADGNLSFSDTINGARNFTTDSGGAATTFSGAIGDAAALTDLDVTAGTINLNANIKTDGGSLTFVGNTVLGAEVIIATEVGTDDSAGSVTFSGGSLSAAGSDRNLTINTVTDGANNSGSVTLASVGNSAGNSIRLLTIFAKPFGTGLAGDVTFTNALSLASDGSLYAEGRTISLSTSNSDFALSGTANATLGATQNIVLASGSSIQTVDGDVSLEANQYATPTAGDFTGISLDQATVRTTGAGSISLFGRSGDAPNLQYGILIQNSSLLEATGAGEVDLSGESRGTSGPENDGILIASSSDILSDTGQISLQGIRGVGSTSEGIGVTDSAVTISTTNAPLFFVADVIHTGATQPNISAGSGNTIFLRPMTAGTAIGLGVASSSVFSLSDAQLDRLTAGTLQIGDSSSGTITISDNITRPNATSINLTAGGNSSITFSGSTAALDSNNGSVTLTLNSAGSGAITSGGALKDVRGTNVSLSSGSGGVGASGNSLITDASSLNATTNGNAAMFLEEIDSVTLDALGLSAGAGTITLSSGTFRLGGSDRVNDNSPLVVTSGTTFQLNGFNETLNSLTGAGAVVNGTAAGATMTLNLAGAETFSGVLGGSTANDNNFGLTKTGNGTLTLSGANTYTGATTISSGTLRYGAFSVLSDTTAITVSSPGVLNLATFGDIVGSLAGDGTVTLGSAPFEVGSDNTSTTFSGTMNGTGQFIKNGSGTFTLAGTITAGGNVTINEGTFRLGSADRIADNRFVAMGLNGILDLDSFNETIGGLSGSVLNRVLLGNGTLTTGGLNINGSFFGAITGNGSLVKEGTATLRLERTNTYTGATSVNAGTLLINGSVTSNVTVASGATVGGTGTINSGNTLIVQSGGTVAPGTSPGILTSGNVTLQSGSAFNVELNGTTVGTQYDQLNVTGTVTIESNVALNTSLGFTPSPGDTFVVINNDGSDAINGTFNGLAQGALLSIGGEKFHIVYNHNSGDGNTNDVALIANHVPVINNQSFSISESSTNGAAVGTVLATDADSVVTFAITGGNTGNVFAISTSTGQITVNDATGLDFETNPTFNLTVEVTDDAGVTDSATITINVTNAAPSAPVDGDAAVNSISEAAISGDTVGIDADSTDAHGGAVTFQLTNDAGGRFTINSTTGVVRVADASLLDFESSSSHTITVEASDGTNVSTQDFTIAVTNVAPSVPSDADVITNSVSEGAINGNLVGIDADSGDVHGGAITFSLTNDAGGRFAIHPMTGIVRVADASLLNFEDATSHVITVQASDGTNSTTANFTISVTNVAPAMPIDGDNSANVVSEGIANGDPVGIDANSGDVHGGTVTFSLTGDAGGRFAIDSATGVVTVADATLLDFSAPISHTITVQASDGTDVATKTFTISVAGSAPDAPLDVDDHANTIPEGALEGSRVGITLFATAPQGSNVFYRLTDNAGGRFAIDPLTGVVMVKDGSRLRFSDATQHTIQAVTVDAQGNASAEESFDINVTQVPVDALPLASILPTRVSVVEGDFGPNFVTFLVKLNKPSSETITIDFTTRTGDDRSFQRPEGIDDTIPFATDEPGPWDFFRSTGQLTFDPGVTEQPLRVQIRPDDRPEDNELFFVQLLSPVNVKLAPQQSIAIARILDDDSVPQLIVENSQVLEGDSAGQNELVFTVRLVGDLAVGTTSATADFSTGNIAIDTAIDGTDYTTTSGTLTFTDTERVREVRIPILGDLDNEADETVSLRFENPINLGLSRSEVVGTILNDDSPNVVVLITPQVYKIREGNDGSQQVEFVVTLVGKPTGDVSVNYTTADETATAGSDYAAASGTLDFTLADIASGNVQKTIFVTTFGDTDIELDETLNVTLSLPDGSLPEVSLAPDRSSSRVVLRNDDQAILTEDGDALAVALSNELTTILGAGPKNNPALIAALRARALEIIQTQGLSKAIVIIIDPVDFVLTDPEGRQAGYTEGTGVVNQIPGTYYSGDGTVELMIVPLPPDGSYNVQLAGLGGDFNASITVLDSNGTSTNIVSQALSEGATSSVSFQVGGQNTIPVGLGLAAAHAAAPSVGVVGAFGQREFQAALASAFETAVANGLEFDGPNSQSAELMLWLAVSTRVVRQQFLEPLWQSLGLPFGDWLGEGQLTPRSIPSEIVDQFWSQVGQTLTGVPSSIYRLGDMLENLIPTLLPGRNRSMPPRAGEQGQSNPAPNNGVKARRSSLERPRTTPQTPPAGSGQAQPPTKPNATKGKSAQTPESPKEDNQQSNAPRTRWLWFTFKDEKSAAKQV